ncbi:MAG: adenylate kinase family protein [Methanobacteriaceae archaeon]|jgi:adenylate kinase|nr:adenylate kinase family protein [Candidatus Methanorudis spinitermitis]
MNKNKKVIFITGTPGVGKTTVATCLNKELSKKYNSKLYKINEISIENDLILGKDSERGYEIVDIDKLNEKLFEIIKKDNIENTLSNNLEILEIVIVEGHLSHLCDNCDKVIVLRLDPKSLEKRLKKRDYLESKIQENLEAESLAVCTVEAFQKHGDIVNEIDTTSMSIDEVIGNIKKIIFDEKDFPVGKIDFMDWLMI